MNFTLCIYFVMIKALSLHTQSFFFLFFLSFKYTHRQSFLKCFSSHQVWEMKSQSVPTLSFFGELSPDLHFLILSTSAGQVAWNGEKASFQRIHFPSNCSSCSCLVYSLFMVSACNPVVCLFSSYA